VLITQAQLVNGAIVDVRLEDGAVTEIADRLPWRKDEEVLDARGGALIPGLHDHHVHLLALAAARTSVAVGPADVTAGGLGTRLRSAAGTGWIRAVGYHESVAGELDRHALDSLVPDRPLRVQHRGGALWMLNSAAIAAIGLADLAADGVERDAAGTPNGRLWRLDDRLRDRIPPVDLDLAAVSDLAARRGVTGYTDATPYTTMEELDHLADAVAGGAVRQRVWSMGAQIDRRLAVGPLKIVLDEPHVPSLETLAERIALAHRVGRPAAVHCVTRVELLLALAALGVAGSSHRDRIEHASVVPPEAITAMRRLHVTVVTQPTFVHERGDDYIREVAADDQPSLYRLRSLRDAGVPVGASTDAPFGSSDPWVAIAAARTRRSRGGMIIGASEALEPLHALSLFLGRADAPGRVRRVARGARDLVLLREPLDAALDDPDATCVARTWIDGVTVYDASDPISTAASRR
jgi:predicted amidohydrolase YtcJ